MRFKITFFLFLSFCGLNGWAQSGKLSLTGLRHNNIFFSEEPITFSASESVNHSLSWSVLNWQQNEVSSGTASVSTNSPLKLPELPLGYYILKYNETNSTNKSQLYFARLPDFTKIHIGYDCPYAVDTAQSWLAHPGFQNNPLQPPNAYSVATDLAKWSGVKQVRDRMSWAGVETVANRYRWDRYATNINLLNSSAIKTMDLFYDAPSWTLRGNQSIPRDLISLYNFTKNASSTFKNKVTEWEFWNEPDGSFCTDPAWEFAAAQKAAFVGFTDGNAQTKVLVGSNMSAPIDPFLKVAYQNNIAPFYDFFNFHFYRPVTDFPWVLANKQQFLQQYQVQNQPWWMTEFGLATEGTGQSPSLVPGQNLLEHNPAQEQEQAEFLVEAFLTGQSLGVDKGFYFIMLPDNEQNGGKVWGLLRWDWSIKPAYVALSNLIAQLGNQKYLGQVTVGYPASGYLFANVASNGTTTSQTLVVWSSSNHKITIPQASQLEVVDLMGKTSTVQGNSLTAGVSPQYIVGLHNLKTDKPFVDHHTSIASTSPRTLIAGQDYKTILSLQFGSSVTISKRVAVVVPGNQTLSATLDIYNFSSGSSQIYLQDKSLGGSIQNLPSQLLMPPMSEKKVTVTMSKSSTPVTNGYFSVGGTSASGKISAVVVPYQ